MTISSRISGIDSPPLGQVLRTELINGQDRALGVVSAFVSVGGLRDLLAITKKRTALECRLLAGISNAITHPQALTEALDAGWKVRLGTAFGARVFHPKMILSGRAFLRDGRVKEPSFTYVGSSNLTKGGLYKNIECGIITHADFAPPSISLCFARLWREGRTATHGSIQSYAKEFARRNRKRSLDDLVELGVVDSTEDERPTYKNLALQRDKPRQKTISEGVAGAAWAGLESFTGDYQFQVEFPQAAGIVLNRIIGSSSSSKVRILCTSDNTVREMTYRYYTDNGMFRLNIPNDTLGVQRARESHEGIALIEVSERSDVIAQLTIVPPGKTLEQIVRRSSLLGTWGSTSTRNYGWY